MNSISIGLLREGQKPHLLIPSRIKSYKRSSFNVGQCYNIRKQSQRNFAVDKRCNPSGCGGIFAQQGKGPPAQVMERFQGVASQLMTQRIIRLGGAVDDDSCNLLVAQLLWLDSIDSKKDITLYINSPGGSVTAGMAVFDTMRHIRPQVSTICVGLAASMGAFLLASGYQGKRYSLPNSRIMIHQPLGGAQGQAADIEIQANEIMHHKSTLNGYLAEFTKKPLEQVMEDTDRDFFMSAQDAVSYGLIDAIIDHPTNVAVSASGIQLYTSDV